MLTIIDLFSEALAIWKQTNWPSVAVFRSDLAVNLVRGEGEIAYYSKSNAFSRPLHGQA